MPVVEITDLNDARLADFAHGTDVLLKNGRGEQGLYIAESALVLERALAAGHTRVRCWRLAAPWTKPLRSSARTCPCFRGRANCLPN